MSPTINSSRPLQAMVSRGKGWCSAAVLITRIRSRCRWLPKSKKWREILYLFYR